MVGVDASAEQEIGKSGKVITGLICRNMMAKLGIAETQLKIFVVPDIDSAKRLNFQGSPSILINRKDIYTGKEPTGFSYACRLYEFGGERTGVIPKEFI